MRDCRVIQNLYTKLHHLRLRNICTYLDECGLTGKELQPFLTTVQAILYISTYVTYLQFTPKFNRQLRSKTDGKASFAKFAEAMDE